MKDNTANQKQLNNLIEFRQRAYSTFGKAKDAQFQIVDAVLSDKRVRSYAELSQTPQFERGWSSAYTAVEDGDCDTAALSKQFVWQLPLEETVVCPLDTTVWAHPKAKMLEGLMYEISPTKAARRQTAVVGHIYSLLGWAQERGSSWCAGLSTQRVTFEQDALQLGITQIKQLSQQREQVGATGLAVVPADGKYGTHHFLAPLKDVSNVAIVARLRRDRVLYLPPPPYSGKGRPRVHGDRFAFKDESTWHTPDEQVEFEDARWGQVRLRGWHNLHMRQDASTSFTAIYVEVRLEREKRPRPIWLALLSATPHPIRQAWLWFDHRWSIEPSIRFRKQKLCWTLPKLQSTAQCDHWSWLVELAFWQLMLGRPLVQDNPLPWQKSQANLTPTRTLRGFARLFGQLGSPTRPCQSRQNGIGWQTGRVRKRKTRFKPQRRSKTRPKATK